MLAYNVQDFCAKGDGRTDDTQAIKAAIVAATARGWDVLFPIGDYLCTSGFTIPVGMRLLGIGTAGAVSDGQIQPYAKLLHNFNGDFFTCDGSGGNSRFGTSFRNLVFSQKFGNLGDATGTAIKCTGSSLSARVGWIRIIDCNFETQTNTCGDWTRSIDIDGSGVNVAADGIRDIFIDRVRCNQGTGGTSGMRFKSCFNVFMTNSHVDNGTGVIEITGTAISPSSSINFSNCTCGTVALDYCQTVHWTGGALTSVTATANTGTLCDFKPGHVGNVIPVTGVFTPGNVTLFCWNATDAAFMPNGNVRTPNGNGYQGRLANGTGVTVITIANDLVAIDPGGNGAQIGTLGGKLAFYGGTVQSKATVTGAKGGNAALTSLLTVLASMGLFVDGTS